MNLSHICSPEVCIRILESGFYTPRYSDPLAGDSGLNCFIEGREYNNNQCFEGSGAEIRMEWLLPLREVTIDEAFPLKPNILFNQEGWRAIIPAGTDRNNIRVTSFKITAKALSLGQRFRLWKIKRKLKKAPICLQIGRA